MIPPVFDFRAILPPAKTAMCYVAIGQRQTGKSYFIDYLLRLLLNAAPTPPCTARRVIVWAPQPEADYIGVELRSLAACREHRDAPSWVFRPPVGAAEVAAFCKELRAVDPLTEIVLVWDEVADAQVSTGGGSPHWRDEAIRECSHSIRGITVLASTQTPDGMPQELRRLADGGYFIFRTVGRGARDRLLNDGIRDDKVAEVGTLPNWKCLWGLPA